MNRYQVGEIVWLRRQSGHVATYWPARVFSLSHRFAEYLTQSKKSMRLNSIRGTQKTKWLLFISTKIVSFISTTMRVRKGKRRLTSTKHFARQKEIIFAGEKFLKMISISQKIQVTGQNSN
jgi:hypothetical protein